VELVPAGRGEREHVDRILRTAATFTLTGENPNLSDTEVDALVESGGCMLVNVTDRLSDHGPSGMVAFRCEADALAVHAMALSCPVLGKQVEYAVLLALARIAASRQLAKVILDYIPAGRNQATLAFLKSSIDGDTDHRFVLPIEQAETRINQAAVSPGAWSLRVSAP
jgi:predicted enzyme involved in methoxymalonyl-ACP biosynthesis